MLMGANSISYCVVLIFQNLKIIKYMYSQTCIKRSPLGRGKEKVAF